MGLYTKPGESMSSERYRQYEFAGSVVRVYEDRTCREFPKCCATAFQERSRVDVAILLRLARRYRRTRLATLPHGVARVCVGRHKGDCP